MADQSQKNPFISSFIPGLILGLVVGGIAGAFLPPIVQNMMNAPPKLPAGGAKTTTSTTPRDARPVPPPAPDDAKDATPKPEEPKPAEPKPAEPKPEEKPATPPAAPPK